MTTLPIPPELAGYSVDILRAELTRREEISELKCALANYLQDLKRCADAAKLNRDFTSSCIEWLDSDVDTIAESMYMNSGVRAGTTSNPAEPHVTPHVDDPDLHVLLTDVEEIWKAAQEGGILFRHSKSPDWLPLKKESRRNIKSLIENGCVFRLTGDYILSLGRVTGSKVSTM